MGNYTEAVVIGVIGLITLIWAVRAIVGSFKTAGGCSSCSSTGDCPLVNNPDALVELTRQGHTTPMDSCHPPTASCADLLASVVDKKPL